MYAPSQGPMASTPQVGEGIDINNIDIERRVIETHKAYLPDHFNGYDRKEARPANRRKPEPTYRYDYTILGTRYNVYTRELPNGKQLVTSMWDGTTGEEIDDLEFLVKRHNHAH